MPPPEHLFPVDDWRIVENRYTDRFMARAETVFAVSNGYLGIRGSLDEGRPSSSPGTFVNGFHDTWTLRNAEEAYGLARTGQTIAAVPDATVMQVYVDDEPLFVPLARVREYERALDMRNGELTRHLLWSAPSGKHVRVSTCRIVSLEYRHLAAVRLEITVLDHDAPVVISSQLANRYDLPHQAKTEPVDDPRIARVSGERVLTCAERTHHGLRMVAGYETTHSHMRVAAGVAHQLDSSAPWKSETKMDDDQGEVTFLIEARAGVPICLTKYISYHTSRSAPVGELCERADRTLTRAVRGGFDHLRTAQRENLDRFWDRADVRINDGDPDTARAQQAIRWNLFQVAQASWRAEGSGIPAKGLTGDGYDGHYFWDTETYVLPFLSYTQPRIARNLLRFRYTMLPAARRHARQLDLAGALFPWRTITGEEASANFQSATAQYHINAAIAHSLVRYMHVRDDLGFALELGAEILIETARLWHDLGFFGDDGFFHIHSVTGPDEYTTVVNDNTYTNLMARQNLLDAAHTVERLQKELPAEFHALAAELELGAAEPADWLRAAEAMYVPYDNSRRIHPQDDSFLDRETWDLSKTPPDKFPLLLHYHPLVIYRFQVLKQADIVLAMFLLGEHFSASQKRRNFDYYDPLTTGDSSLSACVQSVIAAEVDRPSDALAYFAYALLMDLGDAAGNASDGVHIACAAGVWLCLVYGFGGMRDYGGNLSFNPRLPRSWPRLEFSLRFQDRQIRISITHREETYLLEEGDPLTITIRSERYTLRQGHPVVTSGAEVPNGGAG